MAPHSSARKARERHRPWHPSPSPSKRLEAVSPLRDGSSGLGLHRVQGLHRKPYSFSGYGLHRVGTALRVELYPIVTTRVVPPSQATPAPDWPRASTAQCAPWPLHKVLHWCTFPLLRG